MKYVLLGVAVGAYRDRINPRASEEEARAEIMEAVQYAHEVTNKNPGFRRLRCGRRAGKAWSRMYIVITWDGKIVDCQP